MNITLSDINGDQVLVIPIVPPDIPLENPTKNTVFETLNGDINIIGIKGLREFGWESFFPNREYSFAKAGSDVNAFVYIDFLNDCLDRGLPIRIIVTTDNKTTFLNMLASIEVWKYDIDAVEDIGYVLGLKEFNEQL